jgi:hypothetical protein
MELPFRVVENEPKTDQAANLNLWGEATWLDQGRPWLMMTIDDVAYNANVSAYIRARGLWWARRMREV